MGRRFYHEHGPRRDGSRGFAYRAAVAVGIVCLAVVGLWLTFKAINVLLAVFGGIVMAILLCTMAEPLLRWTKLPQWAAVLLVLFLVMGVLSLAGWLMAPSISHQFEQLGDQLPAAIDRVRTKVQEFKWTDWIVQKSSDATSGRNIMGQVTKVFSITLTAGAALAIVTFLSIYMALQPDVYIEGTIRLFPISFRPRARQVMEEIYRVLRVWLVTKLISMLFVGVCVALGLWLLHVPLALALGLLAAIFEFIPTIGPLLSAAPAVLLAFSKDPMQALYVALLYFAVQWVQNHVTNPLLQQKALQLPPALSLFLVAWLGSLFGFGGLLLSGPLSMVALVMVKMLYVDDVLENRHRSVALLPQRDYGHKPRRPAEPGSH